MSGEDPLQQIIALVERDPHSAPALTLYALVNTLEFPRAGYLFKLDKLKDLAPQDRQLAYGLMEMMAEGRIGSPEWQQAKATLDRLVRQG